MDSAERHFLTGWEEYTDANLLGALRGCLRGECYFAGRLFLSPSDKACRALGEENKRLLLEELARRGLEVGERVAPFA